MGKYLNFFMNYRSRSMKSFHVNIVIGFLGEIFMTNSAFVGSLPRVYANMIGQVVLSEKGLATETANVLFLSRMFLNVQTQIIPMDEGLSTLIAGKWSDIFVASDVTFQ